MKCGRCATSHLLEKRTKCGEKRLRAGGQAAGGGAAKTPPSCMLLRRGGQRKGWIGYCCRWVGSEQGIKGDNQQQVHVDASYVGGGQLPGA